MPNLKWDFLHTQIINSAIAASFQRADVYKKSGINKNDRERLRIGLRKALKEISPKYKGRRVSDNEHERRIIKLSKKISRGYAEILFHRHLRIGVVQKALNLYLKYLWCSNKISEPPHCPLDSNIMKLLPRPVRIPWTKITDIQEYHCIISEAKEIARNTSLARWELRKYQKHSRGNILR
jgi:hypothetical protein